MGDFRVTVNAAICFLLFSSIKNPVTSTGLGKCPIYPQLPNYNMRQMVGTWYEVERSFYLMELSASCTSISVDINEKGNMVIITSNINRWTGSPATTYGLGIPSFEGSSLFRYKINNRMPYVIGRLLPGAGQYNVLFTDYTGFAILWSCSSVSIAHSDHIWVLGRTRELSASVRAQVYAIMEDLGLDPDRLILSKNNECPDLQKTTLSVNQTQPTTVVNIINNTIN